MTSADSTVSGAARSTKSASGMQVKQRMQLWFASALSSSNVDKAAREFSTIRQNQAERTLPSILLRKQLAS